MKFIETPWLLIGLLVLLSLSVQSCSVSGDPTWTFLVYMDGDNDLADAAQQNISDMSAAGAADNVQVIIQVALPQVTTKRYRMANGGWTLLADLGQLDMSSPQTLTDFLTWAKDAYPADRTVLVLWDHGDGWDQGEGPSSRTSKIRGMFGDQESGSQQFEPNHQIKLAIMASGITIDLLGLDACTMGTIETLYEFKDVAPIIVSSEEETPDRGWLYLPVLSSLFSNTNMSVEALANIVVASFQSYYETVFYPAQSATFDRRYTISAVRSQYLSLIAQGVDGLAGTLTALLNNTATEAGTVSLIANARESVQAIDFYITPNVYVDLVDLDSRLGQATDIAQYISKAMIAEYHGSGRPNAHGISIVFFTSRQSQTYDPNYKPYDAQTNTGNGGDFINEFRWAEFLQAYYVSAGL
jgi:hypothetical protein